MNLEADNTGMEHLKIIIVSGLSGSGKSTALAALEDAGYYCVDNMPVSLLPDFLKLPIKSGIAGLAFVMDLRELDFLDRYEAVFNIVRGHGHVIEIVFLEAEERILTQRYSQTRRYHPLTQGRGLLEGIRAERKMMEKLRAAADHIIDTSGYTIHELKAVIFGRVKANEKRILMRITVLSFGFKYGIPYDANLIMDVRFLDNPYFVPELKPLDGKTPEIRKYVLENDTARTFMGKYWDLLDYLIPLYEKEGKAYLTLAVGCTGGRHRSVAVAEAVFKKISGDGRWVHMIHRDIHREDFTSSPVV
jgi:UPF0042 nucleotide-binding protein